MFATLLLSGCDKGNNSIGKDVLPDYLKSKPISHNFSVKLRTVEAGTKEHENNIYVSSAKGYLGRIPNKDFGAVETEFMTQFYIPPGFRFRDEAVIQKIDSVRINLYYDRFVGDSIANMSVAAYKITKPLEHNKYSISDVDGYMGEELGKKSFWAGRGDRKLFNNKGKPNGYILSIPVSTALGQEFFDRSKAGDAVFASQKAFDAFFPGIYLRTSAGQGSVIRVNSTELTFYYSKEVEVTDPKTKEKKKVIRPFTQSLIHTSEVAQLSRFVNHATDKLIANTKEAIIKAPAGTWVEMTIPTREMVKLLSEAPSGYTRRLNAATYTLQGIIPDAKSASDPYKLSIPQTILMLPKDRAQKFFEEELTDNVPSEVYTSFLGEIAVPSSNAYIFGNIGPVLIEHIAKKPTEDLVVLLVPVERTTTAPNQGRRTISLSHQVLPSGMKFAIDEKNTTLEATIIEHKMGSPF